VETKSQLTRKHAISHGAPVNSCDWSGPAARGKCAEGDLLLATACDDKVFRLYYGPSKARLRLYKCAGGDLLLATAKAAVGSNKALVRLGRL